MFARERILKDISNSFDIKANILMRWKKEHFDENLKSFYGHKIVDTKSKIHYIGTGIFNVVVVEDKNPIIDYRKTGDGRILVNTNIFDKKDLYRDWTGRSFRIHNSITKEETLHDLTVLFGNDFEDYFSKEEVININTKGIDGFKSLDDLLICLQNIGSNKTIVDNNKLTIICKNRVDVERFMNCKKIKDNIYSLQINDIEYEIIILGEDEGDVPTKFYEKANESMCKEFLLIEKDYINFLGNRNEISTSIKNFLLAYGFSIDFEKKDSFRANPKISVFNKLKQELRYLIARIKY